MSINHRMHLLLSVSALAVLSAGSAYAQDQTAANAPVQEDVVVTGSLLGTANFNAPTPVTQVTGVDVQNLALPGIGIAISELPYAAAGGGLVTNTSGIVSAGQSQVNLRGLGVNRTLVLIDGQRPTSVNPTNNFDTNLIPSALVDHFDVVTTGASASYGSDAVAGVVNLVLKDRLEGFTANVQYGTSQRADEDQALESFAYGTDFADGRGHFIIGGEYAKEYDTVDMYARSWGQAEPSNVLVSLGTNRAANLPANVLANGTEFEGGTPGGLIIKGGTAGNGILGDNFGPGGTISSFQTGSYDGYVFPFPNTGYMIGTGNYGVNGLGRQLEPPYQRGAVLAKGDYDITPDVSVFATVNYGQLETNDPSQGTPFPVTMIINSGNPYIPTALQAAMTAQNVTQITLSKETLDIPGHFANNKNTLLQSLFGLKGTIFDDWTWDLEGNIGRAVRWQGFEDAPITANLYQAVNVVQTPNGPACGPAATNPNITSQPADVKAKLLAQAALYPNCVPLNPFGPNDGSPATAAALNYIFNAPNGNDELHDNIRQYMFNADLKGSPFDLPAGPLYSALGANWRYNSLAQSSPIPAQLGVYSTLDPVPFTINETTWETYGELGAPVVKDLPFAQSIDLNAAARYTNYSISGGVTTWKYGATWDVNSMVRFRATMSEDIRAPNFTDLAQVPVTSASTLTQPDCSCSTRIAAIATTGNPNLQPEFAHDESAGIVLQPDFKDISPWLSGIRLSVDYYRSKINGAIATVAASDVINRCLELNIESYCNQITFAAPNLPGQFTPGTTYLKANFGITTLNLVPTNLNAVIQDGIDIDFKDRLPIDTLGIPGTLDITALGSYINQQRTISVATTGSGASAALTTISVNAADTGSAPRWAWNVSLDYALDRWTTALQLRYYSPILYSTSYVGPNEPSYSPTLPNSINQNLFPAAITVNLHVAYDVIKEDNGEDLQAYVNIDNLFDTDPPVIWNFVSNYDVVGRYFKVGLRYTTP